MTAGEAFGLGALLPIASYGSTQSLHWDGCYLVIVPETVDVVVVIFAKVYPVPFDFLACLEARTT